MDDALPIRFADIEHAADVIRGAVVDTPAARSETLSAITGADIALKFEIFQFTASFKERGAVNKLSTLTEAERARGIIAMSAGNHAQGVAYHARRKVRLSQRSGTPSASAPGSSFPARRSPNRRTPHRCCRSRRAWSSSIPSMIR